MLKDIIDNRYSAKFFDNVEIEQEKIDYILGCALNAPSKQSLYPYKIFVLGNSKKARKFKEWLFWHDTWCSNGNLLDETNKTPENTRFNGQYNAPLLLLYSRRNVSNLEYAPKDLNTDRDVTDIIDLTISASFAMLAAEEQGLRTCFGKCHSNQYVDTVLGAGSVKIELALGVGYATSADNSSIMTSPIKKGKEIVGYCTNNLDQTFPLSRHKIRRNKPSNDDLLIFV
jgi:nitroreductase